MARILIAALAVALLVLVGIFVFRATRPAGDLATGPTGPAGEPPAPAQAVAPNPAAAPAPPAAAPDAGVGAAPARDGAPKKQARASEAVMMDRLRDTLDKGTPQATLDVARELEREYPDGAQAEERSLYAIDALIALGRISEMRAEASKHIARWPGTEISARVMARTGVHPAPQAPPGAR